MQANIKSTGSISVPVLTLSLETLVQRLTSENLELQQALEQSRGQVIKFQQAFEQSQGQIDILTNKNALLTELIQQLKDEIASLTGQNPKPTIKASQLEGQKQKTEWHARFQRTAPSGKCIVFNDWIFSGLQEELFLQPHSFAAISAESASLQSRVFDISWRAQWIITHTRRIGKKGQPKGTARKKKKTILKIHKKSIIQPEIIPEGAEFKGYKPYTVQDIVFEVSNTQYQIAQWRLLDGSYLTGELPPGIQGHYGSEVRTFIWHQYHTCRVTEPLLLDLLKAKGILISAGQLSKILTEQIAAFHEEVKELLPAGVEAEKQLLVDDTGGRHQGTNQYTTVIGNKWFSVFTTTESKSRVNFLQLLQGGKEEYLINADTIAYLEKIGAAAYLVIDMGLNIGAAFTSSAQWGKFLKERNILSQNAVRFVTEAALYASIIAHGIPRDLRIHADDAPQFAICLFDLSLCWLHEERHYRKLIMTTDQARAELELILNQIWILYQQLKKFAVFPQAELVEAIQKQFDDIFLQNTSSPTLNHQLEKTYQKKAELLRVLEWSKTPLHNNSSETDARSAKTKFKVSGGTRSDAGRSARDTFLSLKQTCMKLRINFIAFLQDRVRGLFEIPKLADVIYQRSRAEAISPP